MIIRRSSYRGQRVIAGLSRRGTQRGRTAAEGRPSRGDKRVGPRATPTLVWHRLVVESTRPTRYACAGTGHKGG